MDIECTSSRCGKKKNVHESEKQKTHEKGVAVTDITAALDDDGYLRVWK